jgi:uncharacterized protein YecE (DUF72 family)
VDHPRPPAASSGRILVGTAGWNYPAGKGTWNGVFYPRRPPRGFDELAYYAEHFDAVEVNSSFYRMLEPGQAESWLRRTPASFHFAIKLFQKFTHPDMYLARGAADWDVSRADFDLFRRGLAPLAEAARLAAVLVQFPPSFHADDDTRGYLEWLLGGLSAYPVAVELRHKSWSDDAAGTRALLEAAHAAWAWIDEPKFQSSIRQTGAEASTGAAPLAYFRLHGRNAATWWEHAHADDRYNYLYSREELRPVSESAARAAASGKRTLVMFNNHFSAKAVANAAVLKHDLGQIVPGEYPPEMLARYPELEGVVMVRRDLLA